MKKYPPAIAAYIAENYRGVTTSALTEMVNTAFGTALRESQIHDYKSNHRLSSGVKPGHRESYYSKTFPREVCEYIHANYQGVGPTDMAARLNELFGSVYKVQQLNTFYKNHGIISGVTGCFERGHTSHNKGKKGICSAGCEKGWFSKGRMPQTHKPVGTETLRSDGYWWVKIAEPNRWREKHVLIWEAAHGKRPDGHVVSFLDGNKSNLDLDNLTVITRAEHAVMTHCGFRSDNAEFTRTGILLAKVTIAKTAAKKGRIGRGGVDPRSLSRNGAE